MITQLWEFVKFLALMGVILFLLSIIFVILDIMVLNIREASLKKSLFKELDRQIKEGKVNIMSGEQLEMLNKIDNEEEK